MIIPIRCFTCGKVLASSHQPFLDRTRAGEDAAKVLDDLGMTRYCCRRILLASTELIDDVIPFR